MQGSLSKNDFITLFDLSKDYEIIVLLILYVSKIATFDYHIEFLRYFKRSNHEIVILNI